MMNFSALCEPAREGLAVVGEHTLEALADHVDATLDGAHGDTHVVGDFVILVAGDVERERNAQVVGQTVDGFGDFAGGE